MKVKDEINKNKGIRTVSIEVPLEYPGLTEKERREMYDALGKLSEIFRKADDRIQAKQHDPWRYWNES